MNPTAIPVAPPTTRIARRFAEIGKRSPKPIAFVIGPADAPDETRWRAVEGARQQLVEAGLATFPTVERAAWALGRWVARWEGRTGSSVSPA